MRYILALLLLSTVNAFAGDVYILRTNPTKPGLEAPAYLTIDRVASEASATKVTMVLTNSKNQLIASFPGFSLLTQARCLDCNQNVYGIYRERDDDMPTALDGFQVQFDGKRAGESEAGMVRIGANAFYYEKVL